MPQRPDNHVVGDIAATKVQGILAECGWASDVVYHDYGEDLLVQSSHD